MNRDDRRAYDARPCSCGSGKKYRNCHEVIEREAIVFSHRQVEAVVKMLPFPSRPA
jgi:uncharacterized protein YecA (UPF0149 family)